jgi:hypothetical protein
VADDNCVLDFGATAKEQGDKMEHTTSFNTTIDGNPTTGIAMKESAMESRFNSSVKAPSVLLVDTGPTHGQPTNECHGNDNTSCVTEATASCFFSDWQMNVMKNIKENCRSRQLVEKHGGTRQRSSYRWTWPAPNPSSMFQFSVRISTFIVTRAIRLALWTVLQPVIGRQEVSCAPDTDWKLVRHVPAGNTWHPATDQLRGTDQYGDPNTDQAFSIRFDDDTFTNFLFATGDCEK